MVIMFNRKVEILNKIKAAEMLGVEPKNIHQFKVETPEKRKLTGWIVGSRGFHMGSLLIETVDGEETLQYVQGMPKIHYLKDEIITENVQILDKPDGTNIVLFPLIINNEVEEVLCKTRMMPLADEQFTTLVERIIEQRHDLAVESEKLSFSYELYGYCNSHGINYNCLEIPLRFDLITVLDQGMCLPYWKTLEFADKYELSLIMKHFEWDGIGYQMTPDFEEVYGDYMPTREIPFTDLPSFYNQLEAFYEEMNNIHQEQCKRKEIIIEGSVWHWGNKENYMLKNKATSVKELHFAIAGGVPQAIIQKALHKAHESLPDIKDEEVVIKFVKEELREEYDEEVVEDKKTINRLTKLYTGFLANQVALAKLRIIVEEINKELGNNVDVSTKMRLFAQMYPELKQCSGRVYRIFTKQI